MSTSEDRYPRKKIEVVGKQMAYVDVGEGRPIVFLHGNPTSSYLWRNVIPHVEHLGRCVAPDLIGMGQSDRLEDSGPGSYRFVEHRRYLDAFFDAAGVHEDVIFVIHDWGSALGFDWSYRHPEAVRGLAYMEAILRPFTWAEWPQPFRPLFEQFRSEAGEGLVLDNNVFVEQVLPAAIVRKLEDAEMAAYRAPYLEPGESRRPTLTWPRELPIEGEPADTVAIIEAFGAWLTTTAIPKLFINAEPGAILVGAIRDFCRTFPNQQEVTVEGAHFVQEDAPDEIGAALATWIERL